MGNIWCIGQRLASLVTNNAVSTSSDGVNWNNVAVSGTPFTIPQVGSTLTWYSNLLVATSTAGGVSVSADYINWIKGDIGVEGFAITGMVAPPSFVACGRRHYETAIDGFPAGTEVAQIFKSQTGYPNTYAMIFSTGNTPSGFYGIKYFQEADIGIGPLVPVLIAVGYYDTNPYAVMSLDSGDTWTELSIDAGITGPFYDVEYNPSNKKWYFGSKNSIAIVDNLISQTWTTTVLFGESLSEVTNLKLNPEGQMVAVTPSGLWWSENLENWNKFEMPGYNWQSIAWYNNRWIAGSYSLLTQYTFWYSTDMTTWYPDNNGLYPAAYAISDSPYTRYWINLLGGPGNNLCFGFTLGEDGSTYFVGNSDQGTGLAGVFAKYDTVGNLNWQNKIDSVNNESLISVSINQSGNVFAIGGSTPTIGNGNIQLIKYDKNGNITGQETLESISNTEGIAIDSDSSNIYIVGTSTPSTFGSTDGVMSKLDSNGNIQWQQIIGTSNNDYLNGIKVSQTGNIYTCGNVNSHIFVSKFNNSGSIIWKTELGDNTGNYGAGITIDSNENIIVCGATSINGGSRDAIVTKYTSYGNIIWQQTLSGTGEDQWAGVTTDSDNNIYLAGSTSSVSDNMADMLIAKYSDAGTLIWQRILGGTGHTDSGSSIAIDSANDLYVGGSSDSRNGEYKSIIAKLPSNGSLTGAYSEYLYRTSFLDSAEGTLVSFVSAATVSSGNLIANTTPISSSATSFTNVTYILS